MSSRNFDERYPAMFQPGGDSTGAPTWAPAATNAVTAGPTGTTLTPTPEEIAHATEPISKISSTSAAPAAEGPASSDTWPPWRWLIAAGAAVVMIAAGVFTLMAQYWVPSSMDKDPAKFQGIALQPWGQVVFAAAPALLGTGVAILAALLFLTSRRQAAREPALRIAFAAAAVAVGVTGWVGLFAMVIFPGDMSQWSNGGMNTALPWTYLVGASGTWLFQLALFMLAVLFIVPSRWEHTDAEGHTEDVTLPDDAGLPDHADHASSRHGANPSRSHISGGRPSATRGLGFGAAVAAAGMFALFAPYLYPLATGNVVVELANGGQAIHQDWAYSAQNLVSPLLLVGCLVFGWALISLAITPRRGPAAELDGSAVVLGRAEP